MSAFAFISEWFLIQQYGASKYKSYPNFFKDRRINVKKPHIWLCNKTEKNQ